MSKKVWLPLVVLLLAGAVTWLLLRSSEEIVWSMIHVSGERFSGDAHLLEMPGGQVILIDTGFNRFTRAEVLPHLDRRGIHKIDKLIVTHAHRNHYGGIWSLMELPGKITEVYFNLPPREPCDREDWPTGCNYEHVEQTMELIERSGVSLKTITPGLELFRDDEREILLSVLYIHDGLSEPIGDTDVNDTSAVILLTYGQRSVLFTGDLNLWVGNYLVQADLVPKAEILTAPHHGVEGAASNKFLEKVGAKMMMVSNSKGSWLGDRGRRMRDFVADNGMEVYVTGLNGNVEVTIGGDGYQIKTDR